ncbi:SUMF1/EgtB/PvdO family nonheme iron enzyme [Ohtaekwangia koreensis]|uniref:Formylglycine-generating enzyme, required for sulfatase activity, contains SUMF1/FGE domain n=1 Tax=Ohtaekwangia koreensis TaxID=688867 RepID=A0A1T5M6N3_9BACT|nr:SUMF1/EgtB/PvdO family nonheme iron enzyme [Ohtaekwangia koreensis]SKC83887.1 Formylglycine-generating enzyme, required for sulfatase activity, contains SUMF1/FGE domain [Ohtaekwangia koreensis]
MNVIIHKLVKEYIWISVEIFAIVLLLSFRGIPDYISKEMSVVKGGTLSTIDPVSKAATKVNIRAFLLDRNLVTVADFEVFIKMTHYITEAEKFGNAGIFDAKTGEWTLIDGADFRHPFGKDKPAALPDHPVTQVSWNDARAYAKWKGKRLPTQWEWEHAAKNGESTQQQYSWGEDLVVGGKYKANTWQGSFPYHNTVEDGYATTSPVGAFGASKIGLTDMGGNVWQWCEDSIEPTGRDKEIDPSVRRVLRGGSFLCDPLVCHGFQIVGRSSSTPESSMVHIGFRCAQDLK